jgi:sec-independent protein translocase protein TatB
MVIIGLLFLVLFGPKQLPRMARDIGRFVNEAQRAVEEFKEELMAEDDHLDSANGESPRRPNKECLASWSSSFSTAALTLI